jgi:hypothetical protein
MILVDTSVWIDHLRLHNDRLARLLRAGEVFGHPFVTGELALGNLRNRGAILDALHNLPQAPVASASEVIEFIERNALHGIGIGYIDAHLLAAARLSPGTLIRTRDQRLLAAATRMGLIDSAAH